MKSQQKHAKGYEIVEDPNAILTGFVEKTWGFAVAACVDIARPQFYEPPSCVRDSNLCNTARCTH